MGETMINDDDPVQVMSLRTAACIGLETVPPPGAVERFEGAIDALEQLTLTDVCTLAGAELEAGIRSAIDDGTIEGVVRGEVEALGEGDLNSLTASVADDLLWTCDQYRHRSGPSFEGPYPGEDFPVRTRFRPWIASCARRRIIADHQPTGYLSDAMPADLVALSLLNHLTVEGPYNSAAQTDDLLGRALGEVYQDRNPEDLARVTDQIRLSVLQTMRKSLGSGSSDPVQVGNDPAPLRWACDEMRAAAELVARSLPFGDESALDTALSSLNDLHHLVTTGGGVTPTGNDLDALESARAALEIASGDGDAPLTWAYRIVESVQSAKDRTRLNTRLANTLISTDRWLGAVLGAHHD